MTVESKPFELRNAKDPARVIRGRIEWLADSNEPRPWVLVLHGFLGFMDWGFFPELSRRIAEAGMVAISYNHTGSGVGPDLQEITDGDAIYHNDYTRELEDLAQVRDFVRSLSHPALDLDRAGIVGHSRGAAMGMIHAAEHDDYRAFVSWASIAEVDRFDDRTKKFWRKTGFIPINYKATNRMFKLGLAELEDVEQRGDQLDIVRSCQQLKGTTLLIHGTADETVPVKVVHRLHAVRPGEGNELLVLEDASHTLDAEHPLTEIPPSLQTALHRTMEHLRRALHL